MDTITTGKYSRLVKFAVYVVELGLCALLFWLVNRGDYHWAAGGGPFYQSMTVALLCYLISVVSGGIVLNTRRVKGFQVLLKVLRNIVIFIILCTPILLLARFYSPSWKYYIVWIAALFLCSGIFRLSLRSFLKFVMQKSHNMPQVVFVGCCESNLALYREFTDNPETYCRVHGYFDDDPEGEYHQDSCEWLGRPDEVIQYLKDHREIDELYCCMPTSRNSEAMRILKYCEDNLVRFYSVLDVRNFLYNHAVLTIIAGVPCLSFYDGPLGRLENRILKRSFDIFVSVIALVVVFPIAFIFVSIITSITMPGPIFFTQKRTGRKGKEFTMIKFRSMKVNSQADEVMATEHDPRKTKWGDIMRRTNLDELPQFINVFLGNMSIVGPRPHMVRQTEEYSKVVENYMVRHYVKPGITGWSQVSGFRGEIKDMSQIVGRIENDIWYIEHWSLWLDIYIIFLTVMKTFKGDKQAY